MFEFPRHISRSKRITWGVVGVLFVLALWWVLTDLPISHETTIERGEPIYEELSYTDPQSGEEKTTRVVTGHTTIEVTTPHYIVSRNAMESPANTFREAWTLATEPSGVQGISLAEHVGASTRRVVLGFIIASIIAVPIGILMGLMPYLRAMLGPIVSFLRPLPSISWVPLALVWFGVGEGQKLAIIFMGSFSAALIYSLEATIKVEADLIKAALNLGASKKQLLTRVLLPAALPNIMSGLKVVLAIAWTCVISAEIVGTREGLGSLIWNSKEIFNVSAMLVGIVCISSVVLILDGLFGVLERTLLPWKYKKA